MDDLCREKTKSYEDAELIQSFIGSCKALEFWLIETRSKVTEFDGKDWKTADNQLKSLILIQSEFHIKCELKDELKEKSKQDNLAETDETIQKLEGLFDEVLVLMSKKQAELETICARYQEKVQAGYNSGYLKIRSFPIFLYHIIFFVDF